MPKTEGTIKELEVHLESNDIRRMFVPTIVRKLVQIAIRRGWKLNDLTMLLHMSWNDQGGPES